MRFTQSVNAIFIAPGLAENARHYADTQDLYSLPEKAADIITGGLDG